MRSCSSSLLPPDSTILISHLSPLRPLFRSISIHDHFRPSLIFAPHLTSISIRNPTLTHQNSKGDLANALGNSNPVIIAAMAGWCGPCKVITPYYTSLSDTYERIRFYRFDVDEVQDVAAELGIRAMPTFLMFSGWQKVAELVGAEPQKLLSMLEIYKGEFGIALLNGSATA